MRIEVSQLGDRLGKEASAAKGSATALVNLLRERLERSTVNVLLDGGGTLKLQARPLAFFVALLDLAGQVLFRSQTAGHYLGAGPVDWLELVPKGGGRVRLSAIGAAKKELGAVEAPLVELLDAAEQSARQLTDTLASQLAATPVVRDAALARVAELALLATAKNHATGWTGAALTPATPYPSRAALEATGDPLAAARLWLGKDPPFGAAPQAGQPGSQLGNNHWIVGATFDPAAPRRVALLDWMERVVADRSRQQHLFLVTEDATVLWGRAIAGQISVFEDALAPSVWPSLWDPAITLRRWSFVWDHGTGFSDGLVCRYGVLSSLAGERGTPG